ncbi:MAG: ammonium transporter [Acidimicrobiales bacterium]|jgi:Amt family ammonium transporter
MTRSTTTLWSRRAGRSRVHKVGFGLFGIVAAIALTATPAMAQELTPAEYNAALLTSLWLILAGCLVFLMQAGFALVEAGMTRAKNIGNIMAKNLADMAIGALAFWAVGFGFAFGSDGGSLIGTDSFFLSGMSESFVDGDVLATPSFFFFQVVFAATAVTIASGAMAERTKFSAYLLFSLVMSGFIYPVVVHMFWQGDGILSDLSIGDARFSDFAGSSIVHSAGGWAALMGAVFLGPRIGKYGPDGKPRAIPGHNVGFAVVGVFVLWFGWFGFNAGSELAMDNWVAHCIMTTLLAGSAGVVGAGAAIWRKTGAMDVGMAGNGALAGLVSITAGTGTMSFAGSVAVGFIGGVIVVYSVLFIERRGIDDPVGAVSVHGVCGAWGTLAIGFFARHDDAFLGRDDAGLFYGGGFDQLLVQAIGVVIVAVWVLGTTAILFKVLKSTVGLRVSAEEELAGLDVAEHGSPGYGPEPVLVG